MGKHPSKPRNVTETTGHKSEIFHFPSQSQPPYLVVVDWYSNMKIIDLKGRSSNVVMISEYVVRGIVTIDGEVYAVTREEILNIDKDEKATSLVTNLYKYGLNSLTRVVPFKHQIYILRPGGKNMMRCNPADKTVNDALPGCRLGGGFCCCASDDFIYAMGGLSNETSAMKYDPLINMWTDIGQMKYGRFGSAAAALNSGIYVLGGRGNPPPEFYDPETSTWNEISKMNVYRQGFSACIINNQLYAVGGDWDAEDDPPQQKSVEVYDENRWKIMTKFEMKRFWCACAWPHTQTETARDRVETRRTEAEAQRSQTETPRGQTDIQRNPTVVIHGPVGQVVTGNANIASGDNCVAGSQNIDRSVVAGNIYEGEAHVNTTGGSTTVTKL